ncbi:MAG: hypothetical protein KAH23_08350 [Kiritimatiellae bacterium]|nr:hypothetical protein [Kiritimatiellia bacterium]
MKKITILCMEDQKDSTLENLRALGLLHIKHINEPSSPDLKNGRTDLERTNTAVGILNHYMKEHDTDDLTGHLKQAEVVNKTHELHEKLQKLTTLHDDLHIEAEKLSVYGEIDPGIIENLKEQNIEVRFFSAPDKQVISAPDNTVLTELNNSGSTKVFALTSFGHIEYEGNMLPPPEKKRADVLDEARLLAKQIKEVEKKLVDLSASRKNIENYATIMDDNVKYIEARDGMGTSGKIAYLTGYCPADLINKIKEKSDQNAWGLMIQDPAIEDEVPTLIKYPKIVKPVKAVIEMLEIIPGYKEADISSIFLIFFSIFFAILIGDAGYGLFMLALTIFARKKNKSAPAYTFTLFYILSICTIIWGVLTNNYFGIQPEFLPTILRNLRIPWLTDGVVESRDHIMKLSFFIGACHLTIAHIWNSIVIYPNKKWIAQFGWIMLVWTMYFTACAMVINEPFPLFAYGLLIASTLLILIFMSSPEEFKKEKIGHIMFPLTIVNCFVDVISYIRLFAVGMASLSVAQSFNDIAMRLDFSKIWTIPFIVLILLAGHGLNILLCALGILVHGVRLNTLEFSTHKGLEWSGSKYNPFKKSQIINN